MTAPADPSAGRSARLGQFAALVAFLAVAFSPYPSDLPEPARRVAAVAAAMGVLWLTQAVPLGATSLIPLAAFPLLGVASAKEVSRSYINESVFLYLGGFVIALGIERWGLHRRMALHVVRAVGAGPKKIVLGFSLATAFLSMWVSNTAAAMLMVPIALALVSSLEELNPDGPGDGRATARLGTALMLAVAYAASIGGMATLIGTPTNIAFRQIYADTFPAAPEVSAGGWMAAFVPTAAVLLLAMWLVLTAGLPAIPGASRFGRAFFSERLRSLGPPTSAERRMFAVFAATALLWLFRTPLRLGGPETPALLPGWGPYAAKWLVWLGTPASTAAEMADDSTVAMLMAVSLFFIPAGMPRSRRDGDASGEADAAPVANLMDWPTANRLPWEVLLLFGGGFALADGFKATGLSTWVGGQFETTFAGQPVWALVAAVCLAMTFLTEFTSNTATCNIICPILAAAAVQMGIDPRLLMVPAALSASCAFMLPVATPPNAIVFASGRVRVRQMAAYGLVLNLIGVVVVTLGVLWIYAPQAGIDPAVLPEWAETRPPR